MRVPVRTQVLRYSHSCITPKTDWRGEALRVPDAVTKIKTKFKKCMKYNFKYFGPSQLKMLSFIFKTVKDDSQYYHQISSNIDLSQLRQTSGMVAFLIGSI